MKRTKKNRVWAALLLAFLLTLTGMPTYAEEEEAPATVPTEDTLLSEIMVGVETPYCGSVVDDAGSFLPGYYGSADDLEDVVLTAEADWVTDATGTTPFRGTVTGGDTCYARFVLVPAEGYAFDPNAEFISYEEVEVTVLSRSEEEVVLVLPIVAAHEEDWDTYESEEATCIAPGFERWTCVGCGEEFEKIWDISPDAHEWGDWEVMEEATTTKQGLKKHTCELCGEEEEQVIRKKYAEVYEPDTSWSMSATIAWNADSDTVSVAGEEVRPATAFVWLDSDLKVYDRNGSLLAPDIDSYVQATSASLIPAFYITDAETAAALKTYLSESGPEDCFVVSTPENRDLVKDVADLLHVRGMLDCTAVTAPTKKDLVTMIAQVNGAHGKVILLSQEAATKENIKLLQSLAATVWVKTATDTKSLVTLYTNGVNGVVVDDFRAAISAEELFQDDAPSLLRIPLIIGHRGDPSNYPENTLASAQGAYEEGADSIENDIYLTADGKLYIRHDGNLWMFIGQKNTDGESLTLEEIQSLVFEWDPDSEYGIPQTNEVRNGAATYGILYGGKLYGEEEGLPFTTPSFEEYLQTFKGKLIVHDTEIKSRNPAVIGVLKALVDAYDAWDQVFTITFEHDILDAMYADYPEISVGSLDSYYEGGNYEDITEEDGPETALEALYSVIDRWNATYNPSNYRYGEEMVKAGRHRGLTVWPWTYAIGNEYIDMIFADGYMAGMTGLTTDQAWVASDYIEEISSEDVTTDSLKNVPKPTGTTKTGEVKPLPDAQLVVLEDLNEEGTEKLAIWRYKADMDVNGTSYGYYYLYSNPFVVTLTVPPVKYTLTFDLNGGILDGKEGPILVKAEEGETVIIPEGPVKEGYLFTYWEGSEYYPGDAYTVTGDHTFTAQWEEAELIPETAPAPPEPKPALDRVPNTGDDTMTGLCLLLMTTSLLTMIAVRRRSR